MPGASRGRSGWVAPSVGGGRTFTRVWVGRSVGIQKTHKFASLRVFFLADRSLHKSHVGRTDPTACQYCTVVVPAHREVMDGGDLYAPRDWSSPLRALLGWRVLPSHSDAPCHLLINVGGTLSTGLRYVSDCNADRTANEKLGVTGQKRKYDPFLFTKAKIAARHGSNVKRIGRSAAPERGSHTDLA